MATVVSELNLLVARVVVQEEFPAKGWVGFVCPDHTGALAVVTMMTHKEMRQYVSWLLRAHGETLRARIAKHQPKRNYQVYFVAAHEAATRSAARLMVHKAIRDPAAD